MAKTIALKPFLKTIRSYCDNLSKEEVTDLFCQYAMELPSNERHFFLDRLMILLDRNLSQTLRDSCETKIIESVDSLIENIEERQKSIEDGSFYDSCEYDAEDDYYGDMEAEPISELQGKEIEELFLKADQLFIQNNLEVAGVVYHKLNLLFNYGWEESPLLYEIAHESIKIDWRETLARHCRCVYETSPFEKRLELMIEVLHINAPYYENHYDHSVEILPNLQDISDTKTEELSDWEAFLKALKNALKDNQKNRAFLIRLEAIYQLEGLDAVAAEVLEKKVPVGYLYWLELLKKESSWNEIANVSQEALANIPFNEWRATAARALIEAGTEMKSPALRILGEREHFFSTVDEVALTSLLIESEKQKVRDFELEGIRDFLKAKKSEYSWGNRNPFFLKIKVLLLLGDLEAALNTIDRYAVVGWSHSEKMTGAVYAAILNVLCENSSTATTIRNLYNQYVSNGNGEENSIGEMIRERLAKIKPTPVEKEIWLSWIRDITTARIDHIVSKQHRKAYNRAATAMGGYMECLILNNQKNEASEFLKWNRKVKYNRHTAFHSEIEDILKTSPLLRTL